MIKGGERRIGKSNGRGDIGRIREEEDEEEKRRSKSRKESRK